MVLGRWGEWWHCFLGSSGRFCEVNVCLCVWVPRPDLCWCAIPNVAEVIGIQGVLGVIPEVL